MFGKGASEHQYGKMGICMKTADSQTGLAHPKLLGSFIAGFDTITTHVLLIVFPVALDIFIWFGPHLRIKSLVDGIFAQFSQIPGLNMTQTSDTAQMSRDFWNFVGERFNLLTFIRTIPVGVPSLMSGKSPIEIPVGTPIFWDVPSGAGVLAIWVLFSLLGLSIGTFYYITVSQISLSGKINWRETASQWPGAAAQIVLLALLWVFLFLAISIPASCVISLFLLGGIPLGQIILFMFFGFVVWMFFPLLFSAHGVVVYHLNMVSSVRYSIRVARLNMPATSLFFLVMLLISQVMDIIWRWPSDNSWLALVGILGHGFVSTGLLAASFIYYRDSNQWLQKTLGLSV